MESNMKNLTGGIHSYTGTKKMNVMTCFWLQELKGGGELRGGCIALCKSKDLKQWTYEKPFYAPGMYISPWNVLKFSRWEITGIWFSPLFGSIYYTL